MNQESKRMSIAEVEAALMEMPEEQFEALVDRVAGRRSDPADVDPADVQESRRIMDEIKAGRMNPVPAEEVLAMLGRSSVARLVDEAMRLSIDERAELVDRLIVTLCGDDCYDPEWVAEMNRRIDEIESGTAKTLSEEEFFAKLNARRDARPVS